MFCMFCVLDCALIRASSNKDSMFRCSERSLDQLTTGPAPLPSRFPSHEVKSFSPQLKLIKLTLVIGIGRRVSILTRISSVITLVNSMFSRRLAPFCLAQGTNVDSSQCCFNWLALSTQQWIYLRCISNKTLNPFYSFSN